MDEQEAGDYIDSITYRHPTAMHCPYCGYKLDSSAHPDGRSAPTDGDVSMCLSCVRFSMYVMGGTALRELTLEEQQKVDLDPRAIHLRNNFLISRELYPWRPKQSG